MERGIQGENTEMIGINWRDDEITKDEYVDGPHINTDSNGTRSEV